jgi:hypothetical protein
VAADPQMTTKPFSPLDLPIPENLPIHSWETA